MGFDWGDVIILLASTQQVQYNARGPTGVTWLTQHAEHATWAIAGILTDYQRTSKGSPLNRSATFRTATFTHLPGVKGILSELGLTDLAATVEDCLLLNSTI